MKQRYKNFLTVLFTFISSILLAQNYQIGSVSEYSYYTQHDVGVGASNKAIYGFDIYPNSSAVSTVTEVCFTVGGSYSASDIMPNGFKIWYSNTQYLNESAYPIDYTVVADPTSIVGSNNVCFTNLFTIPGYNYSYIYLTADIAPTATNNATLQVFGQPLVSLLGGNLTQNNAQSNPNDIAIKTFAGLNIYNWDNLPTTNVSPRSKIKLFSLYAYHGIPISYNFNGMLVSLAGTALASDITSLSLEFYDDDYNRRYIVSSIAGVDAGSEIILPSTFSPCVPAWYYGYFELFANISADAVIGRTVGIANVIGENISLSGASFTGTLTGLPAFTFNNVNATVSSIALQPISIYKGINEPIYKFKIQNGNTLATFQNMRFTITGTNVYNNSSYAYLAYNKSSDDFNSISNQQSAYPTYVDANTFIYDFTNIKLDLTANDTYYFYLNYYSNSGLSNTGETIKVSATLLNNASFDNMDLTGSLAQGTTHNFANSSTSIAKVSLPVMSIPVGGSEAIYGVQVSVANQGKANLSFVVTLSGTYTSEDYNRLYLYSSSDNVFSIDDDPNVTSFYTQSSTDKTYRSYSFTPNAINKYYFFSFGSSTSATDGRNVKLVSLSAIADNGSVNINANVNAGSTFTIKKPTVTTSAKNENISPILTPGYYKSVFYTLKINAANADVYFNNLQYTLGGNIPNSNYYVYSYLSEYAQFNPDLNNYIRKVDNNSPVSGNTFNASFGQNLTASKDYYVHFVVYPYGYNQNLNKTIFIQTVSGFDFGIANVSGSAVSGPVCTITSVLTVQPNTNVNYKDFSINSSQKVLVHSFKAISNSGDIIKAINYAVETNLDPTELIKFELYTGYTPGDLSTKELSYINPNYAYPSAAGVNLSFTGLSTSISNQDEEGVHLYAYINTTATGKTIRVNLVDGNVSFSGTTIFSQASIQAPLLTSIVPQATVTSIPVAAKALNPIGNYYPIYQLAVAANGATRVSQIVLSIAGTYTASDIQSLQISQSKYADGRTLINTGTFATTKSETTLPGELLSFNPSINEYNVGNDSLYIFVSAYANNGGVIGRDIQIKLVSILGIPAGTVVNNATEGAKFAIGTPTVVYSTFFPEGRKMHNYTFPLLATMKIEVKDADVNLAGPGVTVQPIGNYSPYFYRMSYTVTKNEIFNINDASSITNSDYYYATTSTSYNLISGLYLPVGTYYLHVYAYAYNMYEGSTFGISLSGLNFTNGSSTGSGGIGNLMTITSNSFIITSLPLSKSKVLTGTDNAVFAKFMVSVTGADQFVEYMNGFTTNGNYAGSDIKPSSFKAWRSNDATFNPSTATLLDKNSNENSLGAFENLSFANVYKFFNEGVSYLYLTADIDPNAVSGRAIGLKNMSGNSVFGFSSYLTDNFSQALKFTPLTFASVASQAITWATLPNLSVTSLPTTVSLSAFASSGLVVAYSVNSGSASVLGNQMTISSEGTVSITANQSGDEFFTPAAAVSQSFSVVTVASAVTLNTAAIGNDEIELYPNPAHDIVIVKGLQGKSTLEIFDLIGNKMEVIAGGNTINVSKYSQGVYLLVINTDTGRTTKKLVVK